MDTNLGSSRPLLKAKLLIPHIASTTVDRPRLHDRLPSEDYQRLTTVVAPAGWGKTTLLASWARSPEWEGRVGWLSLDEADNEPVRFWTYALSALDLVAPDLARDSLAALSAPGFDSVAVALEELLNAAAASQQSYALVLDDFHTVSEPLIHQNVEFLLSYLPPSLRLVIGSRFDPPLPLARMRARGELEEVRVTDLQCTDDEGAELLAGISGLTKVSAEAGSTLVERTEGWPAGLHLAALSLRESHDPEALARELRGGGRHILDYFSAEVLPTLDDREREMLVRCSVLERLSAPLCDAVLGIDDAEDALAHLDRSGLFVTDLGGGWYRCHALFREVLRRELDRRATGAGPDVLGRAANWFLSQGQREEAIEHRLAAADHPGALELLLTSEQWFMERGAASSYLRLGELLAVHISDARLFVAIAAAAGESGRGERCAHWLQAAEPLIDDASEPLPGWRTLRAEADTLSATFLVAGDAEAAYQYSSRAVELENDPTMWGYFMARQAHGGSLIGAGRIEEGVAVLWDCWLSPARDLLPSILLLQAAGQLASILVETGDIAGSLRVTGEVRDVASAAEDAWGHGAAAAIAGMRLAEGRAKMASDPAAAVPALERAVALAEDWGWATLTLAALTSLADAQWSVGDRAAARVTLARASEVADTGEARPSSVDVYAALEVRIGRGTVKAARAEGTLFEELTDRELSILRALRGPLTAREIGAELFLSINTVKGYTKSLYRKLGVERRADAVRRGHELGLI